MSKKAIFTGIYTMQSANLHLKSEALAPGFRPFSGYTDLLKRERDTMTDEAPEQVTLDQVLRVAELAHLALTPEEETEMLRDLNSILGHVAQLNELDTTDVPAMAQVNELLGARDAGHGDALRVDSARPSLDRTAVMAEAPESDGTYFKVPKVIER
jgi:aspartyl-tRNA(Asn)/glutamyl-tRNA(Gln) amidotransferase subunit C